MRVHESGSGLIPMNQQSNINLIPNVSVPPPNLLIPPVGLNNSADANPGSINVIGGVSTRRTNDTFAKENTIQVSWLACAWCTNYLVRNHSFFSVLGYDCRSQRV